MVTHSDSLTRFSAKHTVLSLPRGFSGKEVQRAQCSIEICTKYTANKRRTRFSLKALHIPYRFSLICRGKRVNHRFLTPILADQIAGPPRNMRPQIFENPPILLSWHRNMSTNRCLRVGKGVCLTLHIYTIHILVHMVLQEGIPPKSEAWTGRWPEPPQG